jgi:hypothetical protein
MSWLRVGAVFGSLTSVGLLGVLYAEVGTRIIAIAGTGGSSEGFLSPTVDQVGTVMPYLIAVMILGILVWFVFSSAQSERAVQRRGPR